MNIILLVFKYLDYAIRPELSSPPRFRIQGGGPLSVTEEHGGERKSLCLIFLILDVTLRRSDTVILRHSDTRTRRYSDTVILRHSDIETLPYCHDRPSLQPSLAG